MKRINTILVLLLLGSIFSLRQQAYGQLRIDRTVISNGGTRNSNDNFLLQGTVGQSAVGAKYNNAFQISSGFWFGIDSMVVGISEESPILPLKFKLFNNYPNPFNPTTTINFDVPLASQVRLVIYNIQGQEVRKLVDNPYQPGEHKVAWDGRDNYGRQVSSGVYFIQMHAGEFITMKKALLVR